MTAPALPGSVRSIVQPGMTVWARTDIAGLDTLDRNRHRDGGLVLAIDDTHAHCITDAGDDVRDHTLGLHRSRVALDNIDPDTIDTAHGEPLRYARKALRAIARRHAPRARTTKPVDDWTADTVDLVRTLRSLA